MDTLSRFILRLWLAMLPTLAIELALAADPSSLAGTYRCKVSCRLTDVDPSIEIHGAIALCMNELGGTYSGYLRQDGSVYCFNQVGTLSENGKAIVWSHGAVWERR